MRIAFCLATALLLAGCGRPETPAYFSKVTGIPICGELHVKNLNADSVSRSPGFDSIYVVKLNGPVECIDDLFEKASNLVRAICDRRHPCGGLTARREFLRLEPQPDGGVIVTHST